MWSLFSLKSLTASGKFPLFEGFNYNKLNYHRIINYFLLIIMYPPVFMMALPDIPWLVRIIFY